MAEEPMETVDLEETEVEAPKPEAMAESKKNNANKLYAAKDYKSALKEYNQVIELCPSVAVYYGNRAACYMMLCQYHNALADAKICIELDPTIVKAYSRVIKCCLMLGEIVEAETFLTKKMLVDPTAETTATERKDLDHLKRYLREAEVAYDAKDYRKVVYCMDRCADVSVSCRRFKVTKAECLAYLGRYQEAQELANDVLHQERTNADATFVRGMCLYYQDNVDRAFLHFQEVLRLAPDHTKALEIYKKAKSLKQKKEEGNTAFKMGRYQEAYNLYNEALNVDPLNKSANSKLHFNKATVAAKLGKLNESISECTKALKLDEDYLKAILRRAACFMELENYEEAVRDYEKAYKIDKNRDMRVRQTKEVNVTRERQADYANKDLLRFMNDHNHSTDNRRLLTEAKEALRRSKRKDYYKILGISKNASADDIKKAYKKKALEHHPDRHASSNDLEQKVQEKKFKEVGEAYTILSDPNTRSCYDDGQSFDGVNPTGTSEYETFEAFFHGHGRGRARGGTYQFQTGGFPHFTF